MTIKKCQKRLFLIFIKNKKEKLLFRKKDFSTDNQSYTFIKKKDSDNKIFRKNIVPLNSFFEENIIHMKIITKYLFILVIFLLSSLESYGQDPIFSQYYANPLYLNPALAGSTLSPRAIVNYRNQWPSLAANFVTYNVSYEHYISDINSTFALLANNDRTAGGAFNATSVSLIYTYNLQASRDWFVNLSAQAGLSSRSLHWEDLYFEDAIHPVYGLNYYASSEQPPDKTSIWFPDFSFGVVAGYKDLLYGGIAIHHLAQPSDGLYNKEDSKVYRKYTAHLGANINLKGNRSSWGDKKTSVLSPAVLYQQQLNFKTLSVGLYYTYNPILVGAWYRCNISNPDAVVLMLGLHFNGFQVGYSYDITLSKLANTTGGAHEVSLSYTFKGKTSNNKGSRYDRRGIPCPHF